MATVTMQKDLVVALKKETCLNVGILSKLEAMPPELSRQVFRENALEKPTQNLFNHLSYYLISIINTNASVSLPWPLYDTKTERAYRNELSNIISDYSRKGLLCPVRSSYLVNPGCYKVTMLIFQMSQLAVQKILTSKMKESQEKLYNEMTENYKSQKEGFLEIIEKETVFRLSKFSNYLQKRKVSEKIAELFRKKIMDMEEKLVSLNAQKYLDDLVDGFVDKHTLDEATKTEILKIKNINKPAPFFDNWLLETDRQINELESKWTEKVSPFMSVVKNTQFQTESLISRFIGKADKDAYMIEYNHKTDFICTKELQNQVNSEQKYILKNLVKDEKLCFPNLIRGFLIAISFVLTNAEVGDEIKMFNEYMEGGLRNYSELVLAMTGLLERVVNAQAKLQPRRNNRSRTVKKISEIPPLPDLSDLLCTKDLQSQVLIDNFTTLKVSKHKFNLRGTTNFSFTRPQPKSLLRNPLYEKPKDDFKTSLISCRVSSYDRTNLDVSKSFHNMSVASQSHRPNETIANCSSGFNKEQILRLLSTKNSSSSKKFKYKTERPDINIKKGGLFNESTNTANRSNSLIRSYSSPNLYENKEKRPMSRAGRRKLSIMQEDSPSRLEVSGIMALDKDSFNIPPSAKLNSLKVENTVSMPAITITPAGDKKFDEMLRDFNVDMNNFDDTPKKTQEKTETPKTNAPIIKKTSSLEKIIDRFKKVRANVLPETKDEFRSIAEEKENINIDTRTVNRVLLPDLLSPSCSVPSQKSESEYLDKVCRDLDEKVKRKPRESLGTALGVDQTFLDQFDLVD